MKKNKKITIILAVILAVAIFLAVSNLIKKGNDKTKNNISLNVQTSEAKEQSYVSQKAPSLKDDDKMFGSKNAAVKLFVYEDNASIYSAKLADTLDKIYSENPDQVAIIVRPLVSKDSLDSKISALAIECANDQDKWTAMRALLFSKAKTENFNSEEFGEYAKQVGLDEASFSACLTNQTKSAKIEELSSEAGSYNVTGAPTIFIDGDMIPGARPYEDYVDSNGDSVDGLKTIINKRLSR